MLMQKHSLKALLTALLIEAFVRHAEVISDKAVRGAPACHAMLREHKCRIHETYIVELS